MKYPTLYHSTQQSAFFNHKVFWIWMGVAVIHSAILFWFPMMTFGEGIAWANGRNGDYLVVGNTVYSFVVITVCLKGLLEMNSWSFLSHVSIWGSIGLWFIFLVVYSYFYQLGIPPTPANMVGAATMMYGTPQFWLGLLLVPLTALLPDVIFKSLRVTVFTSETDRIRIAEAMKKDVGPYVPKSSRLLRMATDTGSLMRNMRSVFSRTPSRANAAASEMELEVGRHGFAFSQEEGGAVSQAEYVRRYDTTTRPTRSAAPLPGGT
jgi:phospholipid-transporting ATPase